jgi:hypothetical protein
LNAISTIHAEPVALALPDDIQFADWITLGKDLFTRHRQTEWMLADWLRVGTERFNDEAQFNLFLGEIGVDPKRAIADAKVAKLIPPAWRSDRVSFDVCKHIAKVEDEVTRQRMLKQAVEEHWNEKAANHAVVQHKVETGKLFPDGDDVSRLATEIVRCWNRANPEAREYFFALAEMAAAKDYSIIDQDMAV